MRLRLLDCWSEDEFTSRGVVVWDTAKLVGGHGTRHHSSACGNGVWMMVTTSNSTAVQAIRTEHADEASSRTISKDPWCRYVREASMRFRRRCTPCPTRLCAGGDHATSPWSMGSTESIQGIQVPLSCQLPRWEDSACVVGHTGRYVRMFPGFAREGDVARSRDEGVALGARLSHFYWPLLAAGYHYVNPTPVVEGEAAAPVSLVLASKTEMHPLRNGECKSNGQPKRKTKPLVLRKTRERPRCATSAVFESLIGHLQMLAFLWQHAACCMASALRLSRKCLWYST